MTKDEAVAFVSNLSRVEEEDLLNALLQSMKESVVEAALEDAGFEFKAFQQRGYDEGYESGEEDGFSRGYEQGFADGKDEAAA